MDFKIIVILLVAITSSSAEFDEPLRGQITAKTFQEDEYTFSHLFKRDTTLRHSTYVDAEFQGIGDPVIERLKNKRINPQWLITRYNNALKFGADSQINGEQIVAPLREVMKQRGDTRGIIILSGGHGDEYGNNWVRVTDRMNPSGSIPKIIRAPWRYDPDFWVEDVERFMGRIGDEFQPLRSRISIVDIAEMSVYRFRDIIQSDNHVILGFCYGRNDKAFRYYLNLSPVISKVNPRRL